MAEILLSNKCFLFHEKRNENTWHSKTDVGQDDHLEVRPILENLWNSQNYALQSFVLEEPFGLALIVLNQKFVSCWHQCQFEWNWMCWFSTASVTEPTRNSVSLSLFTFPTCISTHQSWIVIWFVMRLNLFYNLISHPIWVSMCDKFGSLAFRETSDLGPISFVATVKKPAVSPHLQSLC